MVSDSHDIAADGRQAVFIASVVKPFIDRRVIDLVHQMVSRYRAGEADDRWTVGKVGEISAMLGLLSELENIHRRGITAVEKEMRNTNVN